MAKPNHFSEDEARQLEGVIEVFTNTPKAYPRWRAWDVARDNVEPGWTPIVIGIRDETHSRATAVIKWLPGQWSNPKGGTP